MNALDKTKNLAREDIPVEQLLKNEQRFWSKVEVRGQDECWPWLACFRKDGYGAFRLNLGSGVYPLVGAHQAAFMFSGKVTEKVVRHTCDNRWCCNPNHLVGGTQSENLEDMRIRGRENRYKKYPDSVVLLVREKYASGGYTYLSLGQELNIPKTTIQSLITGTRKVAT